MGIMFNECLCKLILDQTGLDETFYQVIPLHIFCTGKSIKLGLHLDIQVCISLRCYDLNCRFVSYCFPTEKIIYVIRNLIITLEKNKSHTNSISTRSVYAIEGHVRINRLGHAGNFVSFCQVYTKHWCF